MKAMIMTQIALNQISTGCLNFDHTFDVAAWKQTENLTDFFKRILRKRARLKHKFEANMAQEE